MRDPMILAAFFYNPQDDHRMSWRHPEAPGREVFGFEFYRRLAETAEEGRLDLIFAPASAPSAALLRWSADAAGRALAGSRHSSRPGSRWPRRRCCR